ARAHLKRTLSGDAEADDASRRDAEHLRIESGADAVAARRQHLGLPTHFEHARTPGIDRRQIVDDDGDPRVALNIAELLPLSEAVSADVDRVRLRVVAERDRHHVRLAVRRGRDPRQALRSKVGDLRGSKDAHSFTLTRYQYLRCRRHAIAGRL